MQENNKDSIQSFQFFDAIGNSTPRGVALVIHGLNLDPERMMPICNFLRKRGISVVRLSLQGHGNNYLNTDLLAEKKARIRAFKKVHRDIWIHEIEEAYLYARQEAEFYQCPLYLVGYSLGGLLGCCYLMTNTAALFDKMILLAPALVKRFSWSLMKPLRVFPGLVIPSLAPKDYRANNGTPIAAYTALQDLLKDFTTNISTKLNIPTLLFIHENDELVSPQKLLQLIREYQLSHWRCHSLSYTSTKVPNSRFYHLIIDEPSVGTENWDFMQQQISSHLTLHHQ